ncbi:MAG: ABC transporter permease [Nitrospirae bacterium]|nr:ABC transporter permease [Nitrospirota bacterium]
MIAPADLLRQALQSLRIHPLRSFLAGLGIVIGVAALMAVVAIGEGNRAVIQDKINELGANVLIIGRYRPAGAREERFIQDRDLLRLQDRCLSVAQVAPQIQHTMRFQYSRETHPIPVIGTTPSYLQVRRLRPLWGRFLMEFDVQEVRNVVVLNETAARRLFRQAIPPEKASLLIEGLEFRCVGIVQDKSTEIGAGVPVAYLPLTTFRKHAPVRELDRAYVALDEGVAIERGMAEVRALLGKIYGPGSAHWVHSALEVVEASRRLVRTATLVIGGVASIALLVGGIGVMNIMLVSVRERTREIGLRKALGAKDKDILRQFLLEGTFLCLSAGLGGIVVGIGVAWLAARMLELPVLYSFLSPLVGIAFSTTVGLVFTYYPARQAARVEPIVALRSE